MFIHKFIFQKCLLVGTLVFWLCKKGEGVLYILSDCPCLQLELYKSYTPKISGDGKPQSAHCHRVNHDVLESG